MTSDLETGARAIYERDEPLGSWERLLEPSREIYRRRFLEAIVRGDAKIDDERE